VLFGKVRRAARLIVAAAAVLGLLAGCGHSTSVKSPGSADASSEASTKSLSVSGQGDAALNEDSATGETPIAPGHADSDSVTGDSSVSAQQAAPSSPSGNSGSVPTESPVPSSSASSADHADSASGVPSGSSSSRSGTSGSASSAPPEASTASSSPPQTSLTDQPKESAATLSVTGNTEWGVVLEPATVALKSGDTVADLLIRTLKSRKLAYETRGAGSLFYVTGIDGLFEFDDGPVSGWKYRVNGEVIDRSAGAYKLEPGDRVEWFYASEDEEASGGGEQP